MHPVRSSPPRSGEGQGGGNVRGKPPLDRDAVRIVLLALCLSGCGRSGTAPAPPSSLAITPGAIRMLAGDDASLAAPGAEEWSSDAPAIATVDPQGHVHAVSAGIATITASRGALSASADITVRTKPVGQAGCDAPDPLHPDLFPVCTDGGGIFGHWIVDGQGLPAFEYDFDERSDPRAAWPNSESIAPIGLVRTDHFHLFGNDRVNAMAVDDGYVQLFGAERGPTWMNRFDEASKNLGGGFSYLNDGASSWTSAYRWTPAPAASRRVFGTGWYRTESTHDGIQVVHTTLAPAGDDPLLVDEVELVNAGNAPVTLAHYEYWDVNRHQLETQWVRTGLAAPPGDAARDALNGNFLQSVSFDPSSKVLRASMTPAPGFTPPAPDAIGDLDGYPPDVFLAALGDTPVDDVFGDQDAFFGAGGAALPDAVALAAPGQLLPATNGQGQPACLVMKSAISLAPGERRHLRFAYGYLPSGKDLSMLGGYASGDLLGATAAAFRSRMVIADLPGLPLLHRETAWRSAMLAGAAVHDDYENVSYTPQGSAYLYLHGGDGAPRDQALFAAATTWTDPGRARGNLEKILSLADASTGQLAYAFGGYGVTGGVAIHTQPSDLDLFVLFAAEEYLAATGDRAFLQTHVPFHPKGAGHPASVQDDTVLDHLRVAFSHLVTQVGTGPHGLVRVHDGDWSDGIVYEDLSPSAIAFTIDHGESVPNTQMAVYVLPRIGDELAGDDPELADAMHLYADTLASPARAAFGTKWFTRAWLVNSIDQSYAKGNDLASDPFHASFLDLEAQPWGILAGLVDGQPRETLLDEIDARLDSPIGPSMREGGMVWPAISQLMTWAWARTRPARAWESLAKQSYASHAALWPEQWIGIWSAPDGFDGAGSDGGTWASPVTPMTDFPVANMNPEAMWILGLARTAGIETVPGGISIAPRGGGHDEYALSLPLLDVEVLPDAIRAVYHAKNGGSIALHVAVPAGATPRVTLDGLPVAASVGAGEVVVPISFAAGESKALLVRW